MVLFVTQLQLQFFLSDTGLRMSDSQVLPFQDSIQLQHCIAQGISSHTGRNRYMTKILGIISM